MQNYWHFVLSSLSKLEQLRICFLLPDFLNSDGIVFLVHRVLIRP